MTGWNDINGKWYYFQPNGEMSKSRWLSDNNKWYYFGSNGEMQTGIIKSDDIWYYANENGEYTDTYCGYCQLDGNAYRIIDGKVIHNCEIPVTMQYQNPELPTGCEITSCAMVLDYWFDGVDKETLADDYLEKGPIGSTSAYDAFVGDPRTEDSFGVYAPPIVSVIDRYCADHNSSLRGHNKTGTAISNLLVDYIDIGNPVMIWATMNMIPSRPTVTWDINDEKITWLANEHCLVLIGYTDDDYIIADPLRGIVRYNRATVEERYGEQGMQSVVVY